jgi:hypothetical protein
MKNRQLAGYIGAFVLSASLSIPSLANARGGHDGDDDDGNGRNARVVKAELIGYQEVPAISSTCQGDFHARISNDNSQIEFELNYSQLQGDVAAAHIHFAQTGVNGGIAVHFCGTGGKPACPGPREGTVSGTITASDVVNVGATPNVQGIVAGELAEVIRALRLGKAYVNVHSTTFPGGECRGQVK